MPRVGAVRLWVALAPFWEREAFVCHADDRLPEGFYATAQELVRQRYPNAKLIGPLPDPTGWLLARAVEWDRSRSYVGTALLYDFGEPG